MDQVFNELSLSASLPNIYAAQEAMTHLKKASDELKNLGFSLNIRVTEDFNTRRVTPDCTVHEYLTRPGRGAEKDLQRVLLSRFSKAPYVERLCTDAGITLLDEYSVGDDVCHGLALASLWDIPALSLAGDARFTPPTTCVSRRCMEADDAGAEHLTEEKCQVGVITREEDVRFYEKAIGDRLRIPTDTGEDLLDYVGSHLPNLVLSAEAGDQLKGLRRGDIHLPKIRSILEELQRAMRDAVIHGTVFSPQGFNYKPRESETATHGKKGEKHTFNFTTDGTQGKKGSQSLLCEAHMYITDANRVYFCADASRGKVYIGHIGSHLPTKNF